MGLSSTPSAMISSPRSRPSATTEPTMVAEPAFTPMVRTK